MESVLSLTQELIAHEKQLSLSVALMISQNEELKKDYLHNDRQHAFETIQKEIEKVKQYLQIENLDIQLHTKDAKSFVKSWDFETYGDDLSPFRKGIMLVQQNKLPLVSIELGKRLNIKALCPIFDKDVYLGSLEVIMGFDEIAQKLKNKKIHFLVLMDKEFLQIGEWMKDLEQINHYVVVNNSCAQNCQEILTSVISKPTLEEGFARKEGFLFGFTPLFDIDALRVGYIGIWFNESLLKESLLLRATLAPNAKPLHVNDINTLKTFDTQREIIIR
ncbi:MAG: hypothetical protein J0647_08870 [Campylobacteraceae bacterium]|nr:hypothetical protein [Campylobacteraceae bacterium]